MAMRYARMSDTYELVLDIINLIFTAIYNLEFLLKFIAFSCKYFTLDSWNRFDFICVIGADLGAALQLANVGGTMAKVAIFFRAFRIMRIFRLLRSYGQVIISTLFIVSLQITNILSLIFLLLFIYSALGINLFAATLYRDAYNEQANFRTFPNAIILLMQVATGENWAQVMYDLADQDSYEGDI